MEGANGLSKEDLAASATPLCCWQEAMAARVVVDSCWRALERSKEPDAAERAMTGSRTAIAENNCKWRREVSEGGGGVVVEGGLIIISRLKEVGTACGRFSHRNHGCADWRRAAITKTAISSKKSAPEYGGLYGVHII